MIGVKPSISGIILVSEKDLENANQPPPDGHEADDDPCLWWRRWRVERYCEHGLEVLLAACAANPLSSSGLLANLVATGEV